jgi:hypothetical protein
MKTKNYMCSICGKHNVKLWRPYTNTKPLICAECAEKAQVPREYKEKTWQEVEGAGCIGRPTGKIIQLPNWQIDKKGQIPSPDGPGPICKKVTNNLSIDLSEISHSYPSETTIMIPAVQIEDDDSNEFWENGLIPKDAYKEWEKLPTR